MDGKVYLVGAGPGDPGLLTLKAKTLLETADVLVYDRLVGRDVMALIPPQTRRIDVGKNAGNHPVPQQEINQILLDEAKAGHTVVRLKGGDPFVFGRGGEELELLTEAGIPFEVVPGITSSIAAPAYGGIPVTHRDYCSSVHIITGHARAGKALDIDFDALVRLQGTLVFMMSVSSAGQIADGLLAAGMAESMPCAVIEQGTLPRQRTLVTVLGRLEETVQANAVHSPAVILVGRVCSLSPQFDWFDKLPLKGRRILVTQPARRASRMAEGLRALGAEVILYPCIETRPIRPLAIPAGMPVPKIAADEAAQAAPETNNLNGDGPHPSGQTPVAFDEFDAGAAAPGTTAEPFDTLVFTSAEGVRSYCDWLLDQGQDMRALAGYRIACIGSATAGALKEYGLRADFIPSVYSGLALGREMIERGFVNRDSRVLLLRTQMASRDVTDALTAAGIPFADVPVYETNLLTQPPLAQLEVDRPIDLITFTSRSCVEGFIQSQQAAGEASATSTQAPATEGTGSADASRSGSTGETPAFAGRTALCIGEQTAAAAAEHGFEVIVSETATIESMLQRAQEV